MLKKIIISIFVFIFIPFTYLFGEEFTLIYTGNTYSSLYPCGRCPYTVGGGVSRRATLIGEIKKKTKNVLIIEGGNFIAGGVFDTNSVDPEKDKIRSRYYFRALEMMGYDLVGIGEGDFYFGSGFLQSIINEAKIEFVSANLKLKGVLPYYVKKIGKIKIAIIGLTSPQIKEKGIKNVESPWKTLEEVLTNINNNKDKVDMVIVVSTLSDSDNKKIAEKYSNNVDVVISSGDNISYPAYEKIKNTLILRPSYQGKVLRMVRFDIENGVINKWSFEKKSLSLDVPEDLRIKALIPACFKDSDCLSRKGLVSRCDKPAEKYAQCVYLEHKLEIVVITRKNCSFCVTYPTEAFLKKIFPYVSYKFLDYRDSEAKNLIGKYSIKTLPAFILPSEISQEEGFSFIRGQLEKRDDRYILKEETAGMFMFLDRKKIPNRIDVFLDFKSKNVSKILAELKKFLQSNHQVKWDIHFVIFKDKEKGKLVVSGGKQGLEEVQRMLAVREVYPDKFFDYLIQRFKKIDSSWWPQIMEDLGIDYVKLMEVVDSPKLVKKMEKDANLAEELKIRDGVVILVNNRFVYKVENINEEVLERSLKDN